MSAFVPPPPPPGVVVPPPPPPAAVPAPPSAPVSGGAAVPNVVKPGGVALDMADLFGPPKTGAKKSLPPWERRKGSTPPTGATPKTGNSPRPSGPLSLNSQSPPPPSSLAGKVLLRVNAEGSFSSLSSLAPASVPQQQQPPGDGANLPMPVVRKSLPHVTLPMSDPNTKTPPPPPPSSIPPPPCVPVPSNAAGAPVAPTQPAPLPPASAPASLPPASVPAPLAAPLPTPGTAATGAAAPAAGLALPAPSPTAVAATAQIVQETLRELRPHLPPPTRTVIAPHVLYQGKQQQVDVSPLGPVPARKGKKSAAAPPEPRVVWHNRYHLQPSPSSPAARFSNCHAHTDCAATSSTRKQWTAQCIVNSTKAKSDWRGAYWQHVDVHRYIARRYFGEPPPVEH